MIKVLHIVSGDLWAGAEVMVYTLLKELAVYTDLDVYVIVLNRGDLARELKNIGIKIELLDESKLSFFEIFTRLSKAMRRLRPDIIHSHRYKENILAYLCTQCCDSPFLIATQHGLPELYSSSVSTWYRKIWGVNRWLLAKRFRKVVAVSEDIRESLVEERGLSNRKLVVIHNGIQLPEMSLEKPHRKNLWIGSAGRFFAVKGYPFLVDIAKEVSTSYKDISFVIAGEGVQFDEVKSKIRQYGLDDLVYLSGFVSGMANFYEGLDIYINTSIHEGIPMSVLEAMAYGLPVIAPRVGGFMEIITDGVEGYLIKDRNPAAFAEKCVLLATNKDLRTKMSLAARKRVIDHFSAERMASQYYKLYRSIVSA